MSKYTDEQLDNMFYTLEKALKQIGSDLEKLKSELGTSCYRMVGKSNTITIPKKVAGDGDIVGVFKIESENPFEGK